MICPYCGSTNSAHKRFCGSCGQDLQGQDQIAANAAPPSYTIGQLPSSSPPPASVVPPDTTFPPSGIPADLLAQRAAMLQAFRARRQQRPRQKGCGGCLGILLALAILGGMAYGAIYGWTHYVVSDPTIYTYTGQSGADSIDAVAWSPDGQRIASGDNKGKIVVWDATTGKHRLVYSGQKQDIQTIVWSPDGQLIASASLDNTVQVWRPSDGSRLLTLQDLNTQANALAWSPSSDQLAIASNDVVIWDVKHNVQNFVYHAPSPSYPKVVAWSPNGTMLAAGDDTNAVRVWDTRSHHLLYTYQGHSRGIEAVAWSPDSQRIVSSSIDDTVQVWDATTGAHVYVYHTPTLESHASSAVSWSADGKRIATLDSEVNVAHVWDAADGDHDFSYHATNTLAWSPDGTRIASPTTDNNVEVWRPDTSFIGHVPRTDVYDTAALGAVITIVVFLIAFVRKRSFGGLLLTLLCAGAFVVLIMVMIQTGWNPLAGLWQYGSAAGSDSGGD